MTLNLKTMILMKMKRQHIKMLLNMRTCIIMRNSRGTSRKESWSLSFRNMSLSLKMEKNFGGTVDPSYVVWPSCPEVALPHWVKVGPPMRWWLIIRQSHYVGRCDRPTKIFFLKRECGARRRFKELGRINLSKEDLREKLEVLRLVGLELWKEDEQLNFG